MLRIIASTLGVAALILSVWFVTGWANYRNSLAAKDAMVKNCMDHGKGFSWSAETHLLVFTTVQVRCFD